MRVIAVKLLCHTSFEQLGAKGDSAERLLQIVAGRVREGFQILIGAPELLVGTLQFRLYPFRLLEQPGIVHGNSGLGGDADQDGFVIFGEFRWKRMAEDKRAENLAGSRSNGSCQITTNGQVTGGHPRVQRVFAIAGILGYIIAADHSLAASGTEQSGVSRHRELCERFALRSREAAEHVRFTLLVREVMEKCAKLRSHKGPADVGDFLGQSFDVELSRQRWADPVEQFRGMPGLVLTGKKDFTLRFGALPVADITRDF